MNPLIKYAVRQVLAWIKEQTDATPNTVDDQVYEMLRNWALGRGLIDEGGGDDPGPVAQGGDGGGP